MLKINNKLVLLLLSFLSLILLNSCSYETTTINLGSGFETWNFTNSSEYEFDENFVEVVNGKAQLKVLDLEHSGEDFNSGNHVGVYYDSESQKSKIINKKNNSLDIRQILPNKRSHLVGYYKMENTWLDSSGLNNHGSNIGSGTSFSTDSKVGDFSGFFMANYVSLPNVLDTSSPFTVIGWFKAESIDGSFRRIIDNSSFDGNGRQGIDCWVVSRTTYFDFSCQMFKNGTITQRLTYSNIVLDTYYHFAFVGDGANSYLFINGTQVMQGLHDSNPPLGNYHIGGSYLGSELFNGKIEELGFYNTNLLPAEINSIYTAQANNTTELSSLWTPEWDNIVGYWKMDGNWQDSSGNELHGTAIADAAFSLDNKVGSSSGIFDGTGDYISMGVVDVTSWSEVSFSAWAKKTTIEGRVLAIQHSGSDDIRLYLGPTSAQFAVDDGTAYGATISGLDPNFFTTWHHYVGTFDGAVVKFYIDGVEVSSVSGASFNFAAANGSTTIAARAVGDNYLTGNIDDAAIWQASLSASEVKIIYNRQKQKYAGHYDSEIINLGSANSTWPDLSWSTSLPFGKELVGDFDSDSNPDSESSSDYSDFSDDLSNGLIASWSLNEESLSGLPNEVIDSSGNARQGQGFNGITTVEEGKFYRGLYFDGVDDFINLGSFQGSDQGFSVSAWIYPEDLIGVHQIVTSYSFSGPAEGAFNQFYLNGDTITGRIHQDRDVNRIGRRSGSIVKENEWQHVMITWNGGSQNSAIKLYLNGLQVDQIDDGNGVFTNASNDIIPLFLGAQNNISTAPVPASPFEGKMDEVAIWSRGLSETEVQKLYRRGANRIKLQVKSCVDSSCNCKSYGSGGSETDCDGDTILNAADTDDIHKSEFIGPGGDGTTYYSELYNRTNTEVTFNCALNITDSDVGVCAPDEITLTAGPKPTGPEFLNIDYTQFVTPQANRYAQYRVYMEADENTACNGEPCLPELTSVSLNPTGITRYSSEYIKVKPKSPITFTKLLSAQIDAEACATFRLSRSNTEYYFDGTSWVLAATNIHRNTASEVESNITKYAIDHGVGELEVNAYLRSDASQSTQCSVNSIDIKYE